MPVGIQAVLASRSACSRHSAIQMSRSVHNCSEFGMAGTGCHPKQSLRNTRPVVTCKTQSTTSQHGQLLLCRSFSEAEITNIRDNQKSTCMRSMMTRMVCTSSCITATCLTDACRMQESSCKWLV